MLCFRFSWLQSPCPTTTRMPTKRTPGNIMSTSLEVALEIEDDVLDFIRLKLLKG